MTTRTGIGLSELTDGHECGQSAARQALSQLGEAKPTLALLFTSHADPQSVLRGANELLAETPLIGATSAGEYSHEGTVEGGAGVMLVVSDQMQIHPLSHQQGWFRRGKLLGNLAGLSDRGLGSPFHHRKLILFPDDRSMNLDVLVERAMTETAMLYDIVGGPGPSIPEPPRPPAVFFNRKVIHAGLAAAEILSQQPIGMALANGWTPISGPYRVTKTDERRIVRIDGRPAREVYEDFAAGQGYDPSMLGAEMLLQHPVGICEEGECKVSVVMGFDAAGALLVTSPPPKSSLIHILATRPEQMTAAAQRALTQAFVPLGGQPMAGLLFIDCMSTAMVLGDAAEQQREVVRRTAGDLPFLGFRSHGVLARFQGQTAGHFECSVAACVIPG